MPFVTKAIVELIMLVVLLIVSLVVVMRNNTQLQQSEQTLLTEREQLLLNQETLQAKANKLEKERDALLESYVRLVEDRRKAREAFAQLDAALDEAVESLEVAERHYGIPARTHEERSAETNPFKVSLDHLQVLPYESDFHLKGNN